MGPVTVQTNTISKVYHARSTNVTSTTAVSYSVATLSSECLPKHDENTINQRGFRFGNAIMVRFHEVCILALSRSGI